MYCLLFVKWQTNWNWGYVDIKVSLSLDFQQFQQVDPVTVSLLWIYYVNWMTVQYRVVIEVDTEISTISVSYIYLSIKYKIIGCKMFYAHRNQKCKGNNCWLERIGSGPGEDGGPPHVLLHLSVWRVLCHDDVSGHSTWLMLSQLHYIYQTNPSADVI